MNQQAYLLYRKWKASLYRLLFYAFRILPIRQNRICICTFEGRNGFCCNPKYLVQELHRRHPDFEFIWLVNDFSHTFPDYIKTERNTMLNRARVLSTSKVWIDNYRTPYGTRKRRGQFYLNANHYTTAIKSTGLWRKGGFSPIAYLVSKNDSDQMDALVTDSDWCDMVMPKGMLFEGRYLRTGAPRCDILYGDRSKPRRLFRERHNLPGDAKVCMYAPTFREGAKDGKRFVYDRDGVVDFARLLSALTERFGGEWYLCLRVHPQLAAVHKDHTVEKEGSVNGDNKNTDNPLYGHVIDESHADDMYEILAAMDAYVTDYSSAVFEAGYAGIPAFLFMDDLETYEKNRGSLLWSFDINDLSHIKNNREMTPDLDVLLPFPVAQDNDELEMIIQSFDETEYRNRLARFHSAIRLTFDGHASERLADVVEGWME